MSHQYQQGVHKQSPMPNSSEGTLSHKDKSLDMMKDLCGHSSGSGDNECDDSTYLAADSQSSGDGSTSFTRQSISSADDTHDGSANPYRCDLGDPSHGGLAWGVDGECFDPTYSSDEWRPSYDAIEAQTGRTLDERARARLLEVLRLNGIVVDLLDMRDERSRELECHLEALRLNGIMVDLRDMRDERSRELERLCGKVQLEEAFDEADRDSVGTVPSPQMLEQVISKSGNVNQQFPVKRMRTMRLLPPSARTLIVFNVPGSYSQEDLLLVWPPDGTYDYLHTPYHFFNDRTVGHAYINFITYEAAVAFQERWHGRYLSQRDTKNMLDIAVAPNQGRGPNLARIAEDKIPMLVEKRFLPVLLDGERRLDTHEVLAEWSRSRPSGESQPGVGAFGAWQ